MMPALECYQHAAYCFARTAEDETNRRMLVNLAQQRRRRRRRWASRRQPDRYCTRRPRAVA
jgi:hypothetical protein